MTTVAVIGAGQAGLSASYYLKLLGIEHVVFEKEASLASSWRRLWASFHLITCNWQLNLPGGKYHGDDPNGFLSKNQVVSYFHEYVSSFHPPIVFNTNVVSILWQEERKLFRIISEGSELEVRNVIVATGAFQRPNIPEYSNQVPSGIQQLHTFDYRSPSSLNGSRVLVIGSGQSGTQIAEELHQSGKQVFLSVGMTGQLPRTYRGRDVTRWAHDMGEYEWTISDLRQPEERFHANPYIVNYQGQDFFGLRKLYKDGITLLGRLTAFNNDDAQFANDLGSRLDYAATYALEFVESVDTFVLKTRLKDIPEQNEMYAAIRRKFEVPQIDTLSLRDTGLTILWATGYKPDFRFINLDIFDEEEMPVHNRGVTRFPGFYFLGLPWQHTLSSHLLFGVGKDAQYIVNHIAKRETLT